VPPSIHHDTAPLRLGGPMVNDVNEEATNLGTPIFQNPGTLEDLKSATALFWKHVNVGILGRCTNDLSLE